jgi:hypothetical protein
VKRAVVVNTDGTTETIDLSASSELSALQGAVGGWVQVIEINNNLAMWLNEEGKLESLPHNRVAQWYWDMAFGADTDYIVGNVVFTGGLDREGETLGLTEEQVASLTNVRETLSA